ncbi:flagellar basal body-associated FliL family protein [uncultured Desulfobacter sp.]|uniref:flagellar basal body-associated FliL family protein n=1 Tax=uncultured Desulfobacter sp. TaxID=240139 RepID=UPI0029F4879F|nr:flagellar basal body-associated FliL family protein [uncultured Desulfobacter sp.]
MNDQIILGGIVADDLLEKLEDDELIESMNDEDGDSEEKPVKTGFIGKLLSGKKKLIIILLLALFLLIGIGAGAFLLLSGGKEEETQEQATEEDVVTEESIQAALEDQNKAIFEDIVQLEPFEQIFLKQDSTMHYISLGIALEMIEPEFRRQVYTMEPRIRKIIETQMRQMRWMELRTPQGKIKLKVALLNRINQIFPKVAIRHIYFTKFIMQ